MASTFKPTEFETGSISKAPILSPDDFDTWCLRMEGFIKYQDVLMWKSVVDGPYCPKVASTIAGDAIDAKAMTCLMTSIPNSIFVGFKHWQSAKELWEALKLHYAGSADSKENKKDMLKQRFENFTHKEGESTTEQYFRYVELIHSLQALGVKYENRDILRKLLSALHSEW